MIQKGREEERVGFIMKASDVRNWMGLYVLILLGVLGGYCFIAPDYLLPLENSDRVASFEIIVPLLVAQVSVIYRFYADRLESEQQMLPDLPSWTVKAPLIIVSLLLGTELTLFGVAGMTRTKPPSPETFKGLVTFCVALLNASTVLIITKYFQSKPSVPVQDAVQNAKSNS